MARALLRWLRHPDPLKDRVLLYCLIRGALVVYFLLFGTLAVQSMVDAGVVSEATARRFTLHYRVVDITYFVAIVLQAVSLHRGRLERTAKTASIAMDLVAISWIFAHWVGSLTNLLVSFYLFLPLTYRLVYDRRTSYVGTALCAASYLSVALAERFGVLAYGPLRDRPPPLELTEAALFYPTVSYLVVVLFAASLIFNLSLDRLDRSQKRLVHAEGLSAIAQLANGAAHEIGNPLGSARSLLESAGEDLSRVSESEEVTEARRAISLATSSIDWARIVLMQLSEFSNQSLARSDSIPLNELVREAWERLARGWQGPLPPVQWDLAEPLRTVPGNMLQVRQAIAHIQDNALQALKSRPDADLRFSTIQETDAVAFTCRDGGPGIPKTLLEQVRQPFFTTRRETRALGLGLYIVQQVAAQHFGELAIESQEGRGTLVTLRLPFSTDQAA